MDLQRLERAIKDNPFTRNLHALHSEALRQGVSDIAAIDQLSADCEYNDINPADQFTGFNLLEFCRCKDLCPGDCNVLANFYGTKSPTGDP